MKIYTILEKNLKILFRTKFSLFILFIGPLVMIFILGALFNNFNLYNINVGYYVENENEINAKYVNTLYENFNLLKYDSEAACINSIRRGLNHVCIFFKGVGSLNLLEIQIDSSKNNIDTLVENLILGTLDIQTHQYQLNNTRALEEIIEQSEENANLVAEQIPKLNLVISNINNSHQELVKHLKTLKILFKSDKLDVDELVENSDDVKDSIQGFLEKGHTSLDIMEEAIVDVNSGINHATFNTTGDEEELEDIIDIIELEVDKLRDEINKLGSKKNIDFVNNNLGVLVVDLDEIEKTMNKLIIDFESLKDVLGKSNIILSNSTRLINESNAALLISIDKIKVRESGMIVSPVNINIKSALPTFKTHLSQVLPQILISLILVISVILSSNFVMSEKRSDASFRNFLSKAKGYQFFLGNLITLVLIVFLQMLIILIVYYFFLLGNFTMEILIILAVIIPTIIVFVLLGMLIGYLSTSQSSNIVLSFMVILLLLAFSGFVVPLEILSNSFLKFVIYNPYLIASGIFRKLILFNSGFTLLYFELIVLGCEMIFLLLLCLMFESIGRKGLVYRYTLILSEKTSSAIKRVGRKQNKEDSEKQDKENHEKQNKETHEKQSKKNPEKQDKKSHEKQYKESHKKQAKETHEKQAKEIHKKQDKESHKKQAKETHKKQGKEIHKKH